MKQTWNIILSWVRHLQLLGLSLIILTAYVKWRAGHHNEGISNYLRDDDHFMELLTIDLAVCGIAYAVRHDHHMGGQTTRLEEQLTELRRLEGLLWTRRKGPFPQYLSDIGKLAETASHLDILIDCLDYGSFFLPHVHQEVHNQICSAAKRSMRIRVLVCGEMPEPFTGPSGQALNRYEEPQKLLRDYCVALKEDKGFKGWVERLGSQKNTNFAAFAQAWLKQPKAGPDNTSIRQYPDASTLDKCIEVCSGQLSISTAIEDELLLHTLLQIRQLWFAEELQRAGVDIRALSNTEPMFFWFKYKDERTGREITDDALFTFAKAARGPKQLGYTTRDPDLLDTFSAIFNEKWDEAEKQSEPEWLKFLKKQCLL